MRAKTLKCQLDLLLLALLEDGPRHGYAVIEELRRRSGEALDLPEGTMYPALHRLERAGLLQSTWNDTSGRRRRTYSLTQRGTRAVHEKRVEWQSFATVVHAVVGGKAAPAWPSLA